MKWQLPNSAGGSVISSVLTTVPLEEALDFLESGVPLFAFLLEGVSWIDVKKPISTSSFQNESKTLKLCLQVSVIIGAHSSV